MTGRAGQVRADALSALADVPLWRQPQAGWAEVAQILGRMAGALELTGQRRLDALRAATSELELAAPVRIRRFEHPAADAPDDISERVNRLIHQLARPEEDESPDDAGGATAGQ